MSVDIPAANKRYCGRYSFLSSMLKSVRNSCLMPATRRASFDCDYCVPVSCVFLIGEPLLVLLLRVFSHSPTL